MKETQLSARQASAADIRRSGRLSVYELFAAQVSREPDAIAIEAGAVRRSYGALNARVERLAAALAGRGVRYGERVAGLSENRAE
jgi:non-ribosomal peptide synthetase component F